MDRSAQICRVNKPRICSQGISGIPLRGTRVEIEFLRNASPREPAAGRSRAAALRFAKTSIVPLVAWAAPSTREYAARRAREDRRVPRGKTAGRPGRRARYGRRDTVRGQKLSTTEILVCTLETANHADCPDCIPEPFARRGLRAIIILALMAGIRGRPISVARPPVLPRGSSAPADSLAILRANRRDVRGSRRSDPAIRDPCSRSTKDDRDRRRPLVFTRSPFPAPRLPT